MNFGKWKSGLPGGASSPYVGILSSLTTLKNLILLRAGFLPVDNVGNAWRLRTIEEVVTAGHKF